MVEEIIADRCQCHDTIFGFVCLSKNVSYLSVELDNLCSILYFACNANIFIEYNSLQIMKIQHPFELQFR